MCGISGFVSNNSIEQSQVIINEMMSALTHRGPDFCQSYITSVSHRQMALGHNLLSIIGNAHDGRQPFETEWGILVFNGAIYNFEELKKTFSSYKFKTKTDTELLAVGLGIEGLSFVQKLRGMFSFGYFHKSSTELTLVRDSHGVKPLYYKKGINSFVFSSEYKSILPFYGSFLINEESAAKYLKKRYIPGEETLVSSIFKVPHGNMLTLNTETLDFVIVPFTPNSSVQHSKTLIEVLRTAVLRRKVASVEVAGLLSGGIDSGLVCDFLSEEESNFTAYTLDVGDSSLDETPVAATVAAKLHISHKKIPFKESDIGQLRKLIYHLDDPYGDPIILSLDRIFDQIKGKQRVIVTGEGSDEIFSGYIHHRAIGLFDYVPGALTGVMSLVLSLLPISLIKMMLPYSGKLSTEDLGIAIERFKFFLKTRKLQAFHDIFHLFDESEIKTKSSETSNAIASLKTVRDWDFNNWLPSSQLFKLDKISMKSSIEAREPFVDIDLFNYVDKMSPEKHISLTQDKVFLRQSVKGKSRLPLSIIDSRKTSFFQPVNKQTASALIQDMSELIKTNKSFLEKFIETPSLEKVVSQFDSGLIAQKKVFCLASLVLWKQEVFSKVGSSVQRLDL